MNKTIEHNKKLAEKFKEQIKNERWDWHGTLFHFKCVSCSGYCTAVNFIFCEKDPEKVKCFNCQQKGQ